MAHATRSRTSKKGIRPNVTTISTALDAARTAAKVLSVSQHEIDRETCEIADLCADLCGRLCKLGELASVVGQSNGDFNDELLQLEGIANEGASNAIEKANDLRDWANSRATMSATVTPVKAKKAGKAVRK